MIALDEDALVCDFAETYHIYDMYQLPVGYVATLAVGLRSNSRIKMAMDGLRVEVNTLLLAHIADNTAINAWFKTENAKTGQNRPPSMLKALTQDDDEEEAAVGFDSGDDFINEWERINHE